MQVSLQWTGQEEETIAQIMVNENVRRIEAIQAMQRRKRAASSISQRLKLQDPFDSLARCQNRRCVECALSSGESDLEMTAFLDVMLNGKQRSGDYFLVQRDLRNGHVPGDPTTGLFPVSARMDDGPSVPVTEDAEWTDLVPKEPYEPALELTKDGIIQSRVYGRPKHTFGEFRKSEETEVLGRTANMSANVDGLIPVLENLDLDTCVSVNPNKALRGRGRPKVSDDQKRLLAAERQARFRDKRKQDYPHAAKISIRLLDCTKEGRPRKNPVERDRPL
jgi:hypothetical protein